MDLNTVTICEADYQEQLQQCIAVRRQVFVVEQHVPEHLEVDGYDEQRVHVMAKFENHIIGTIRLWHCNEQEAKAERLAVLKQYRQCGIGRALLEHVEKKARSWGCRKLKLGAQVQVIDFYTRLGYLLEGDVFLDAGIKHKHMYKML